MVALVFGWCLRFGQFVLWLWDVAGFGDVDWITVVLCCFMLVVFLLVCYVVLLRWLNGVNSVVFDFHSSFFVCFKFSYCLIGVVLMLVYLFQFVCCSVYLVVTSTCCFVFVGCLVCLCVVCCRLWTFGCRFVVYACYISFVFDFVVVYFNSVVFIMFVYVVYLQ